MLSREYTNNTNYTDTEMYCDDLENNEFAGEEYALRDLEAEIINSPTVRRMQIISPIV